LLRFNFRRPPSVNETIRRQFYASKAARLFDFD
jgi:hypothetical protein